MKIALVAQHSHEYRLLADLTIYRNKQDYCRRWKFGFEVRVGQKKFLASGGHAGGLTWDRLDFLRELMRLGRYEWLYCVGTDTLITNFTISLESFVDNNFHLVIAADGCAPVQADSFLIRCSDQGYAYLSDLLSHYEEFKRHVWVENEVMIRLMGKYAAITKIVPQRVLNSYDYSLYPPATPWMEKHQDMNGNDGQWHYGDFLIHWPGMALPTRIALAQHYYALKLIKQ